METVDYLTWACQIFGEQSLNVYMPLGCICVIMKAMNFLLRLPLLLALPALTCSSAKPASQAGEPTAPAQHNGLADNGLADNGLALVEAEFEKFVVSDFNWELMGNDVLVLRKEGKSSYTAPVVSQEGTKRRPVMVPKWHTVEWNADPAKIALLETKLKEAKFRSLDALYINREVSDGQSVAYLLYDSDGAKRVQCSNQFPEAIADLRRFLQEEFIKPQHARLTTVPGLSRQDAQVYWKPYERTP